MGQKATLDKLPSDVRDYLDQCLQNPALNLTEVSEEVNDYLVSVLGLKPVITWKIVQRHNAKQKKSKKELQRHQAVTREVIKQYGGISLADMGKGIASLVDGLAINTINNLDKEKLEIKDVKDLVSIAKGVSETAAINFDLEIRQEAHDKQKRGEKIIPHEELDVIYEEQLQRQAEMQEKIKHRKPKDDEGDYLEADE